MSHPKKIPGTGTVNQLPVIDITVGVFGYVVAIHIK